MLHEKDTSKLAKLAIFSGCRKETLTLLLQGAFLQKIPARVELAREGENADFLHVIISGTVELYATCRDRETTIAVIGAPHTFIVAAVVLDRFYLKSARVLQPAKILMIPALAVRKAMKEDTAFAVAIATELAIAYRNLAEDLKNQKLRSGLERLANWLVLRDRETGETHRFVIPFEKKVLAARLGMTPEALSRGFAALAAYKVAITGSEVAIHDPESLTLLAKPDPLIDDSHI
ncbi:helix-turn-helix domain-containing protein [Rhodoblastus sp.]|uniref:helix-turn-helix domain-containing protein n=1 Tax=Rhodoblastus sp. TaxID=1962975 RepID=UPI0025F747A8|nr:helix-turn-helix domain-containing protein [Rhodoblastus sp.]